MNKKLRLTSAAALGLLSITALAGCGGKSTSSLRVGLILLHPAASSTYDKNFYDAFMEAKEKLGFTSVVREDVREEGSDCKDVAIELSQQGCDIVIADSFGHEDNMIEAAKACPNTMFCHATGNKAATAALPNYFNAFASIYEGRYLAGVTAGLKLKEMYGDDITDAEAKVGYVGAYPYAEVKSGFTAWYLGVKSVVENATMEVTYTSTWYDENKENAAAVKLIGRGAKLLSQHADSYGAPNACEAAGIPNVSYNGSTLAQCPNTFLVSSKIDWAPYYEYVINCVVNGESITKDYVGNFSTGSVKLTDFSNNCAAGTAEYVNTVKAELMAGTRHVFDITKFTIGGQTPTEDLVAPDKEWTFDYPDGTQFLKGGYYNESIYRSAPSFDILIDGITEIA